MEERELKTGVHVTQITVQAAFYALPETVENILLGAPAYVSEAEILFRALATLSNEQRRQLISLNIMAHVDSPLGALFSAGSQLIRTDDTTGIDYYHFQRAAVPIDDPEYCPGCGTFLGSDLNPLCEHPSGCGKMRSIPLE